MNPEQARYTNFADKSCGPSIWARLFDKIPWNNHFLNRLMRGPNNFGARLIDALRIQHKIIYNPLVLYIYYHYYSFISIIIRHYIYNYDISKPLLLILLSILLRYIFFFCMNQTNKEIILLVSLPELSCSEMPILFSCVKNRKYPKL